MTDGRVLAVGGGSNTVTTAELWDPATGKWSNVGSLVIVGAALAHGGVAQPAEVPAPASDSPAAAPATEEPLATSDASPDAGDVQDQAGD